MQQLILFDFTPEADLSRWRIVDDVVMGGQSSGTFSITSEGYGRFAGHISLENNGGFSSVRYRFATLNIAKALWWYYV